MSAESTPLPSWASEAGGWCDGEAAERFRAVVRQIGPGVHIVGCQNRRPDGSLYVDDLQVEVDEVVHRDPQDAARFAATLAEASATLTAIVLAEAGAALGVAEGPGRAWEDDDAWTQVQEGNLERVRSARVGEAAGAGVYAVVTERRDVDAEPLPRRAAVDVDGPGWTPTLTTAEARDLARVLIEAAVIAEGEQTGR